MRLLLPIAALFSLLLSACASAPGLAPKAVDQSGALRIHPGLLGQPVQPELQPQDAPPPAAPAAEASKVDNTSGLKVDEAGLRTQRSIYFDFNSAELKADSTAVLRAHAGYLAQHPKARIRIEGNADERGADGHNRKLGLKRAEVVKQFLLSQGAAGRQVRITSLGATNPKLKGHDEQSWAENRRADIVYEKE